MRAFESHIILEGDAAITCVTLDGRQRKLVVGDSNGGVNVLNFANGAVMKQLDPHESVVSSLTYCAEV